MSLKQRVENECLTSHDEFALLMKLRLIHGGLRVRISKQSTPEEGGREGLKCMIIDIPAYIVREKKRV